MFTRPLVASALLCLFLLFGATSAYAHTLIIQSSAMQIYTRGQMACQTAPPVTINSTSDDFFGTLGGVLGSLTGTAAGTYSAEIYDKDDRLVAFLTTPRPSSSDLMEVLLRVVDDGAENTAGAIEDDLYAGVSPVGRFASGRIVLTIRGNWPGFTAELAGQGQRTPVVGCSGSGFAEITVPFTIQPS